MGNSSSSWTDLLAGVIDSPEWRAEQIVITARAMVRAAKTASSLQAMERNELETADSHEMLGRPKHAQLATERARRIREEWADQCRRTAWHARDIARLALGRERIDETTAGTGLGQDDRQMVSEVSGAGDQW